jgi:hypothetical protein
MGSQLTAAVEAFVMWQHLNLAGMSTFVPTAANPLRCNFTYRCFFEHNDKTSLMIRSSDTFNRFWLFSDYYYDNDGAIATSSYLQMQNGLSSNDAQWLDAKLDDGFAFTGKMTAYGVTAGQTSYTPGNSYPCVSTATGNPYRIYSHVPGRNCLITILAPF